MRAWKAGLMAVAVLSASSTAEAAGLARAASVATSLTNDVRTIIPVVAVLALLVLGVLWGCRVIHFVTLCQFGAGIVLAGSAVEVVSMLFP